MQKGSKPAYSKLMVVALKKPILTLIISFGLFAASFALFPVIGFRLLPTPEKPIFPINLRMPLQTSLNESNRITAMVEDSFKNDKS